MKNAMNLFYFFGFTHWKAKIFLIIKLFKLCVAFYNAFTMEKFVFVRPHQINFLFDGPARTYILKIDFLILFLNFPRSASGNEIMSISRISFFLYVFLIMIAKTF